MRVDLLPRRGRRSVGCPWATRGRGQRILTSDSSVPVRHDPWAALRQRDFRLFAASRLLSNAGSTMQQAAILWQVYHISNSALQLGLIGLVRFAPALGLSLVGGAVADTYDRRKLMLITQAVPLLTSLALFLTTRSGAASLPLIYLLVFLLAIATAFEMPARQAILPRSRAIPFRTRSR